MIDGIDYFPKRDKYKKGIDQEWNELKKARMEPKKNKTKKPGSEQEKKKSDPV